MIARALASAFVLSFALVSAPTWGDEGLIQDEFDEFIAELLDLGETPLHTAAKDGDVAAVEALIDGGADPMARAKGGETPLHWAAEGNDNPAVVEALLDAGANIGARNEAGFTSLHYAAGHNANPAVVEALLDAGANLEARSVARSFTPLHVAAFWSDAPAVVEALLDAGADPTAKDADGKTPFEYAMDNETLKGTAVYWRLNEERFQ